MSKYKNIALVSSYVPFIDGGATNIVKWLANKLELSGFNTEIIWIPEDHAPDKILQQVKIYELLDLSDADLVITFRPMSHLIKHPNKIVWFIHHIRSFYDLWDTESHDSFRTKKNKKIREIIINLDTVSFHTAKRIFTNSVETQNRLAKFNGINSEVLYPPLLNSELYHCSSQNDEILCIGRIESHKRPDLFVKSLALTKSAVKLRFLGKASDDNYADELTHLISDLNLNDRISFENRWVTENEKIEKLSNCLALIYAPLMEDSYGYPSLEASNSFKPIITTTDSGGVLELVLHDFNGWVVEPLEFAIAKVFDEAFTNPIITKQKGINAKQRLEDFNISWDYVIEKLLS
jgi:glycosyltransferase involved in cell wall biosynthesis